MSTDYKDYQDIVRKSISSLSASDKQELLHLFVLDDRNDEKIDINRLELENIYGLNKEHQSTMDRTLELMLNLVRGTERSTTDKLKVILEKDSPLKGQEIIEVIKDLNKSKKNSLKELRKFLKELRKFAKQNDKARLENQESGRNTWSGNITAGKVVGLVGVFLLTVLAGGGDKRCR